MSLEIKRIKLYKVFRKVATENNLLSAFDTQYPDFSTWERTNFKDENSVISIWNKALKAFLEPTSKQDFFGTFACDILSTSTYCGGGSTTTTGTTTGNTINTTGNTTNATGNTTTNVVNITTDEVANGGKLVKQGMSGNIVREIQKLLIKHGFTNISKSGKIDGIYGSRTAQAVYDFQQKSEIATDRVVGKETWGKLIQEPTATKVVAPKLDPKTGLPDNSLGLPKFDTSVDRFNKFGISKEKQDADLKKLGLKENMKLTDIVNGMVQEQSVIPGVGIDRGNGYYSPGFPSVKDVLNPPKDEVTQIPYARGQGWWTNIINYAKALGYENVSTDGNQVVIEVTPTKRVIIRKDGTFAQGNGDEDYVEGAKWTFSNGKLNINKNGKIYDLKTIQTASTTKPQQQPNSLTDVSKGGYLRFGMKGNVVRDMQVLINSLNVPEIKIDTNGVFNQQTLDAVIKVQKMLGVKPKNGKYGIFGPITIGAINKSKTGANDKFKIDPKTGLPFDTVGAMRDKLPNADTTTTNSNTSSPKFDTDASRFNKYGISKAQQDADLKKLGINEDFIKKIVGKQLRSL